MMDSEYSQLNTRRLLTPSGIHSALIMLVLFLMFYMPQVSADNMNQSSSPLTDNNKQYYQLDNINIPHLFDDGRLRLHGAGNRNVFYNNVYSVALYTEQPNLSATEIINSNNPVVVRLYIRSQLVTLERFKKQTRDSLKRVAKLAPDTSHVDVEDLLNSFSEGFSVGDVWDLSYQPEFHEISIYRNAKFIRKVVGQDLKYALLKAWLSEKPIQKSLREALLSGNFD